ncbi:MAG: hypothetical protein K0U78_13630 [Actinomycetia bacterium]|nr:hypothetical protein [Actinomycetes bacterium]
MSEILGHDVNGRPLRAGDRVIVLDAEPEFRGYEGRQCSVVRRDYDGEVVVDMPAEAGCYFAADGPCFRRLEDRTDHQPSDFTFDSLMDHLKTGVPDHA